MPELALLGGTPEIQTPFPKYRSMGAAEKEAVAGVMDDDCLSGFFGSWQSGFLGGPRVQAFEKAWQQRFGAKWAVSVNSNTSGLIAAMGAIGIGPGDEVIVPPTTMSATAMAPIFYGGIPVFVDMEPDHFCIDPDRVIAALTNRTRAVIAVNLFGHPASLARLREICDQRGIYLIEDNAQGPLAREKGRYCGTIGHIGVFSLNYHKHLHTGEGGVCTTDDDDLARRMQMIRNHAEAVAEQAGVEDLTNLVGMNLRMTELSAAVGLVQLENIDTHVQRRVAVAEQLTDGLAGLDGIVVPKVAENCNHVYYNWMLRFDADVVGCSRQRFNQALNAEGFSTFEGYVKPLYHLPVFKHRIAIGTEGFPFNLTDNDYENVDCPVAESLYQNEFLGYQVCNDDLDRDMTAQLVSAFLKVYENRHELVA